MATGKVLPFVVMLLLLFTAAVTGWLLLDDVRLPDVEDVLELVGLDSKEFGGFVKDVDPGTGEDLYFLRYEEFIAILALKIKQQEKRIQALEEAA